MATVLAVMSWLIVRKPAGLRRIPVTAWACGVVACLNAGCWSIVTPPFQVPDEPDHVAYVMELAETAKMPTAGAPAEFPDAEINALNGLHQGFVRFKPQFPAIASLAEQDELQRDLALPYSTGQTVNAGLAANEPPLYYALEAIPYELGSGGTLLERLQLMRLLSVLMAGITAVFTVLFVRELFPRSPSAWIVGGLGVSLMPLLGFVSGGVNPEVMLTTVSAAAFYALARGFRRGLTQQLAIAIGCLVAIGFVTKLNFVGLAPGILLGLILLTVHAVRASERAALRWLAISMSVACAPVALYVLVNLFSARPGLGIASDALRARTGSVFREVSYIWQFYLPRLPTMKSDFPGILTTHHLWFDGFVGLYGWVDTLFPSWVYDLALVPAALIAGLGARALVTKRVQVRRHLAELVVYATIAAGLMVLVGADSYISASPYWEPRYFLPLAPLLAIVLALATRGAGRRWGRTVGVLIVVMFFAHDIFSQLQVVARYYG
jgi:4-amino-4-deoxy-L-arabinose transferase-like glycosyltransferase